MQGILDRLRVQQPRRHGEGRVTGIGDEDFVPGIQQHAHGQVQSLLGAGCHEHTGRVNRGARLGRDPLRERGAKRRDARVRGVSGLVTGQRVLCSLQHMLRRREPRFTDAEHYRIGGGPGCLCYFTDLVRVYGTHMGGELGHNRMLQPGSRAVPEAGPEQGTEPGSGVWAPAPRIY